MKLTDVYIPLKICNVLFGIPFNKSQDKLLFILNYIILYSKWYIYICKRNEKAVRFSALLKYIKHILQLEKEIAILKKKEKEFEENWAFVQDVL